MKNLSIETFLDYKFISNLMISKDGLHTAFVVSKPCIETNSYLSKLWLMNNETKEIKQLTTIKDVTQVSWYDNETIIFKSNRDDKVNEKIKNHEQISVYYEINIYHGEAQEKFRYDISVSNYKDINDNTKVLMANYDNNLPNLDDLDNSQRKEVLKNYYNSGYTVFEEVPFWFNGQGVINRKRNRLYLEENNILTALTKPLFNTVEFIANDKYIVYSGYEYDDIRPKSPGIYLYDLGTKETKCLIDINNYGIQILDFYNVDKVLLLINDKKEFGMNQNTVLYIYDLTTNSLELIYKPINEEIGKNTTNSDVRYGGGYTYKVVEDKLYYVSTNVNNAYLKCLDLKDYTVTMISELNSVDCFDVYENNIYMVGQKQNSLQEIYSLNQVLTCFNKAVQEEYKLGKIEEHHIINKDNIQIDGYVIKPTDYKDSNKYPAILHIHGGPKTVFSDIFHHEMQVWANKGYFVIYCNPRGSDGKGNEFADIRGKYGTIDYDDLMHFLDSAIEKYSSIDISRLGVTGGSYGGFMTNWIIGHTNRFKCAVSQRSIANWSTFEGTSDIGINFALDQVAASHTTDFNKQWEQSPLKYADKATTPTLFIHAEQDYRCWMVEALQMFTALKMHGVESRLCLIKNENHDLSRNGKPRNRIKRMEEIIAWLESYLR